MRPNTIGSATTMIGADGTFWCLLIVFKGDPKSNLNDIVIPDGDDRSRRVGNAPLRVVYRCSVTGYVTPEIWRDFFDEFEDCLKDQGQFIPRILLMDNLSLHKDVEVIKELYDSGFYILFLPPNSSAFLQPLDDILFANFKKMLLKLYKDLLAKGRLMDWESAVTRNGLVACLYPAFRSSFKKEQVMTAWRNTGLVPYDFPRILRSWQRISTTKTPLLLEVEKEMLPLVSKVMDVAKNDVGKMAMSVRRTSGVRLNAGMKRRGRLADYVDGAGVSTLDIVPESGEDTEKGVRVPVERKRQRRDVSSGLLPAAKRVKSAIARTVGRTVGGLTSFVRKVVQKPTRKKKANPRRKATTASSQGKKGKPQRKRQNPHNRHNLQGLFDVFSMFVTPAPETPQ